MEKTLLLSSNNLESASVLQAVKAESLYKPHAQNWDFSKNILSFTRMKNSKNVMEISSAKLASKKPAQIAGAKGKMLDTIGAWQRTKGLFTSPQFRTVTASTTSTRTLLLWLAADLKTKQPSLSG